MMKKVLKMNHQPLDPIQLVGRMPNVINIIINDNKNHNYHCHDIFPSHSFVDMTWVSVIIITNNYYFIITIIINHSS